MLKIDIDMCLHSATICIYLRYKLVSMLMELKFACELMQVVDVSNHQMQIASYSQYRVLGYGHAPCGIEMDYFWQFENNFLLLANPFGHPMQGYPQVSHFQI